MFHRTHPMTGLGRLLLLVSLLAPSAFAEEWYDAYTRGVEALKRREADKAIDLLERAVRKKPEPGTNLITYGTNRLDEYAPYLFLADAYLAAGKPDRAREALQRSEKFGKEPAAKRAKLAERVEAAEHKAAAAVVTASSPALPVSPSPVVAQAPPSTAPVAQAPTARATEAPTVQTAPVARTAPSNGTLELATDPTGATAFLSGRFLGTTPLSIDLAPGGYDVILRKEGAAEQHFPVRIEPGRRATENRTLILTAAPSAQNPPATVSLVVRSDPPGATVYLDDEPLGATDPTSGRLVMNGITPGAHRVRLSAPGRGDFTESVQVAAVGATTVQAVLPASSAGTRWLPVAAVAAALLLVAIGFVLWRRQNEAPTPTAVLPRGTARPATATSERAEQPTRAAAMTGRATAVAAPTLPQDPEALETRALSTESAGPASEMFGEYRLLELLGKGGMASVYLAERRGERCALKRPLSAFLDDPEFLARFLREAEIGHTLHHPNIIRIFDQGEVGKIPYFTMELVKGETLQAYVRRHGALAPREATTFVSQVAEALDYAHLKGVVHRDLKPSNIMISDDRMIKVMDYGIARARRFEGLTVTGAFMGTPDYVAPETAEGKGTDARSDLYSLGIVFYEILTGKKPFVGDTPFATLRKHCTEPPTPPSVLTPGTPKELEAIILKLLSKDPAERHPGAEELLLELRAYLNRAA